MKHDMLKIDGEVEDQDTEDDFRDVRQLKLIEKAPASLLGEDGNARQSCWEGQTYGDGVYHHHAQITDPTRYFQCGQTTARGKNFPKEHDDEDAKEKSESDEWLALSEQGPHDLGLHSSPVVTFIKIDEFFG